MSLVLSTHSISKSTSWVHPFFQWSAHCNPKEASSNLFVSKSDTRDQIFILPCRASSTCFLLIFILLSLWMHIWGSEFHLICIHTRECLLFWCAQLHGLHLHNVLHSDFVIHDSKPTPPLVGLPLLSCSAQRSVLTYTSHAEISLQFGNS